MRTSFIMSWIKRNYVLSALILAAFFVFLIISYIFIFKSNDVSTVLVKKDNVVATVSVSGRVVPSAQADLSFESSGRVDSINVKVGDKVVLGQELVSLDTSTARADLIKAQAQFDQQNFKLIEMQSGLRAEDIAISQTSVDNAQIELAQLYANAYTTFQDALAKSDSAIRYRVDGFFDSPDSSNPTLVFRYKVNDAVLVDNLQQTREDMEVLFRDWSRLVNKPIEQQTFALSLSETKKYLQQVKSFLDELSFAVNVLTADNYLSQTTIDTYKSNLSSGRSEVSSAISAVNTIEQTIKATESTLAGYKSQLALKKAGYSESELAIQQAVVSEQRGVVSSGYSALQKRIIKAPFAGIVSRQDAKIGEIAQVGDVLVSVISDATFEIEANVPEMDISKILVGNLVEVKLDAYGDSVIFDAKVARINPAEEIIDGVPTYKVVVQFNQSDDRIRSGMTANLDIITDKKENALVIPYRAVSLVDGKSMVTVVMDGKHVEKTIVVGLRGSFGTVEVVEGLEIGQEIVIAN